MILIYITQPWPRSVDSRGQLEISNARLGGICQGLTQSLSRVTLSNAKGLNGNQEAHWTHNTTTQANKDMLRETVGRLLHLRVSEQLSQEPKLL